MFLLNLFEKSLFNKMQVAVQIKKYTIAYFAKKPKAMTTPNATAFRNRGLSIWQISKYKLSDQKNNKRTSVLIINEENETPGKRKKVKPENIAISLSNNFFESR